MRIGVIFFIILVISLIPCKAMFFGNPKKQDFNKPSSIKYSRKEIFDIDSQIKRTKADIYLDTLIKDRLGERYRRANSHDLYPLELPKKLAKKLNYEGEIDMMQFYNYSRKNLEKISGGKLLKFYKFNFDGDNAGTKDYAIIVFDTKKKRPYLVVINKEKTLFKEKLKATYLEPINYGRFPTEVVYEDNKTRFVTNPAVRVVAFEDKSYILYFDAKEKDWEKLYID